MLPPVLLYLALIASPVLAGGPPNPIPGVKAPPKVKPTKLDDFAWANPFSSSKIRQFDAACDSSRTFSASEFQLHDLSDPEPTGLKPYNEALKGLFGGRPYPGGWEGIDAHGYERNMLKMEYAQVPLKVRDWIEEQERTQGPGKGLFAVFDKPAKDETVKSTANLEDSDDLRALDEKRVVIFAPGAIYENLPLWVAEDSGCEDALSDLSSYSPKLVDGGVVGWTTEHKAPSRRQGVRKMDFTLKAQVLGVKSETPADESDKAAVESEEPFDESQTPFQGTDETVESETPTEKTEEPVKTDIKDEL